MKFLRKLFDHEYKELKRFSALADQIMALDAEYTKLTDYELQAKTSQFKERLEKGETLDDILVEAFATAREAAYRVIGEKHYYVQILGGLAIHFGNIAEMKTGEGKTLTSVLPAYLNALSGEGVHIITVNEYLAGRDAEWMGGIHRFLGLTVGVNKRDMNAKEKQEAYACDILYSTNNEIGFDYLRDNMVVRKEDRVQRKLNFAIIDEVDSVLIDEARTPLIISGGNMKSANLYIDADRFAKGLKIEKDFIYDEKTKNVNLTETGSEKAEKTFNISNLYDIDNASLLHYINQALRANYSMKKDVDYVVQEGSSEKIFVNYEKYAKVLREIKPYLSRIVKLDFNPSEMIGVNVLYSENSAYNVKCKKNVFGELHPYDGWIYAYLSQLGIACAYSNDASASGRIVALSGQTVRNYTPLQLERLFENNFVILTGDNVEALCDMGLNHLIGVDSYEVMPELDGKHAMEQINSDDEIFGVKKLRATAQFFCGSYLNIKYSTKKRTVYTKMLNYDESVVGDGIVKVNNALIIPYENTRSDQQVPISLLCPLREYAIKKALMENPFGVGSLYFVEEENVCI